MDEIFENLDDNMIEYDGNDIRIIIDNNDKLWFNVKDVILTLEYKNYRDVIKTKLDRKYVKMKKDIDADKDAYQPLSLYVSEPGFYKLIARSRLPAAKRFTDWVYENLLPTLRKYGKYTLKKELNNEMVELSNKINVLTKQNEIYKNELTKEKYPCGGVFYVINYTEDFGYPVYRIGKTDNMKTRKAAYTTHSGVKRSMVITIQVENPVQVETCMRSLLYDYRYKNRKDFYECDLQIIEECLETIKRRKNKTKQQTGGSNNLDTIDKIISETSDRMDKINAKICKIDKILYG